MFDQLERVLARVSKPVQYIGGELNAAVKDWDAAEVRWALMYPDAYEVGLPNQGVQILYEILNEADGVLAQRSYAVWPDLEALMREHAIPAFTVDGHRPLGAFDLLGMSFSTELCYTNMLTSLDLAGIPLHSAIALTTTRWSSMGGHAAFNPEPVADFVDAVVLGDGEQAVLAISDIVRAFRTEHPDYGLSDEPGEATLRRELLERLAASGTVYVPALLRRGVPARRPDRSGRAQQPRGAVAGGQAHPDGSRRVALPQEPLVPLAETVHERMSVEIFRGCTRGCRFCQAGMITRPVRERSDGHLRRDDRERPAQDRLRGGRDALAEQRRPLGDRRVAPRAWPTATRASRCRCPCRAPGWTRSTSTWPTSCPATAGAPA